MIPLFSKTKNSNYHLILVLLLAVLSFSYLFLSFKGLNQPFAMDQAQIAREVARGNGMTTHFVRPLTLSQTIQKKGEQTVPNAIKDANHAPLNILVQSAAIFLVGGTHFDAWKIDPGSMLYGLDRVIASTSLIFFILSVFVIFRLVREIFDDLIASITCALIIINDFFMQFAISGLPQMMMLFLFTLGCTYLYNALRDKGENKSPFRNLILTAVFFTLLVLTNWIAIWVMIGVIIFVGFHFRDVKFRTLPFIGFLLLALAWPIYQNYINTGNPFGTAIFGLPGIYGGEEGESLRALSHGGLQPPFDLVKGLLAASIEQIKGIIENMGGLIIVPIFFLCLFHKYKKQETNSFKIALLLIWGMSLIGMTICAEPDQSPIAPIQLQILSAPFFTAFALSMIFMTIARRSTHGEGKKLKIASIAFIFLASAGSLLLTLPDQIRLGLMTSNRFRVNWPPYAPAALNGPLHQATQATPTSLIATDQPWAVAWYADRPALWLPKSVKNLMEIDGIISQMNSQIGGILITPTSSLKTPSKIASSCGEFAPYALDSFLLEYGNPSNNVSLSTTAPSLAPLGNRFSGENSRLLLMGIKMVYYSATPLPPALLN